MKRAKNEELKNSKAKIKDEIRWLKTEPYDLSEINRLPIELLCVIFRKLSVEDLLRCEFVCKLWNQIVGCLNLRELVIAKRLKQRPRFWAYSGDQCSVNSILIRSNLNINALESSFLFCIKQLKICNSFDHGKNLDAPPLLTDSVFVSVQKSFSSSIWKLSAWMLRQCAFLAASQRSNFLIISNLKNLKFFQHQ